MTTTIAVQMHNPGGTRYLLSWDETGTYTHCLGPVTPFEAQDIEERGLADVFEVWLSNTSPDDDDAEWANDQQWQAPDETENTTL